MVYSQCEEEELLPLAQRLVDYIENDDAKSAIFKKYSHKRLLRASLYAKDWCEKGNRLPETPVKQ